MPNIMVDPAIKFEPITARLKAGSPSVFEVGEMEEI